MSSVSTAGGKYMIVASGFGLMSERVLTLISARSESIESDLTSYAGSDALVSI